MSDEMNWVHYLAISLIVVTAALGNSLVIYVLISRRAAFLNKPYNYFILNLAVVDFLTAIFLVFSRFLYLPPTPTNDETVSEIFCVTIWSGRLPFDLGYISIFTCVALTIERWVAVVRPTTYRSVKTKHAILAVVFVWFWGFAVNASTFFRIQYLPTEKRCTWVPLGFAEDEVPWIDLTLQSIIPYATMVVLYCHIYLRIKKLPEISSNQDSQLKRVTIVALLACSALVISWLPGRVTFMLSKFGYLHPHGIVHTSSVIITFFNSLNPFLYGACSSRFRAEYKIVFHKAMTFCTAKVQDSFQGNALPANSGNPAPGDPSVNASVISAT